MPAAPRSDRSRSSQPSVSGVILAAGLARRMGRPKLLLPLQGRPLLQHAIDAARGSTLDEVVLVLGPDAELVARALRSHAPGAPLRIATNPDPGAGLSASLRVGLEAVDPRALAAAILLGDQPGVDAALIDRVLEEFFASGRPAARPRFEPGDGRRVPGHPVVLARSLWPELLRLSGDRGAGALLEARPGRLHEIVVRAEPPPDVDRWQDYQRLLEGPAR